MCFGSGVVENRIILSIIFHLLLRKCCTTYHIFQLLPFYPVGMTIGACWHAQFLHLTGLGLSWIVTCSSTRLDGDFGCASSGYSTFTSTYLYLGHARSFSRSWWDFTITTLWNQFHAGPYFPHCPDARCARRSFSLRVGCDKIGRLATIARFRISWFEGRFLAISNSPETHDNLNFVIYFTKDLCVELAVIKYEVAVSYYSDVQWSSTRFMIDSRAE